MPRKPKPVCSSPQCLLSGIRHNASPVYHRLFTLPDGTVKCAGGPALPDEARRERSRTVCIDLELDEEDLKQEKFLCHAEYQVCFKLFCLEGCVYFCVWLWHSHFEPRKDFLLLAYGRTTRVSQSSEAQAINMRKRCWMLSWVDTLLKPYCV